MVVYNHTEQTRVRAETKVTFNHLIKQQYGHCIVCYEKYVTIKLICATPILHRYYSTYTTGIRFL